VLDGTDSELTINVYRDGDELIKTFKTTNLLAWK
jgi:hypothetical protein